MNHADALDLVADVRVESSLCINLKTVLLGDGAGEARLALLRARFAPWYFVVSEESYKRIVLSRKDLFGAG